MPVSTTGATVAHGLNSPVPVMGVSPLRSELEDRLVVVVIVSTGGALVPVVLHGVQEDVL